MKEIPELTLETMKRMEDMTWFSHAQIFDDLVIVAQKETACYIWKTSGGLVIFDGIWPDERVYHEIQNAIKEAGWDNIRVSKFIMTHGHIDHVGCGKYLVDGYHVKTYLSKQDDELRLSTEREENRSDSWKEFKIDYYIKDGNIIDCGDKSVHVVSTPGHTDGCMSFIFPVHDMGKKHVAALFGGATPPWNNLAGIETHRASINKFMDTAKFEHADIVLTNHTAFDNGLIRIEYSRARMKHLPNIYIVGEDGFCNFCEMFMKLAK